MSFTSSYLAESAEILARLDTAAIEALATVLARVRADGGRLFILGVGGSAGHAGHAVNDFRKLCGFEAYAPTDNVSELTARINDEGLDTSFVEWLRGHNAPLPPERQVGFYGLDFYSLHTSIAAVIDYLDQIDPEAARIKGIKSEVAGRAQILVVPDLEAGNMLAKNLIYLAKADSAGIVLGARVPIVLTSRADSVRSRMASCAVAVLFADARRRATVLPAA